MAQKGSRHEIITDGRRRASRPTGGGSRPKSIPAIRGSFRMPRAAAGDARPGFPLTSPRLSRKLIRSAKRVLRKGKPHMRNLDFIQLVACSFLVSIFCVASPALGVITVEGVAEKKVYANTVSFRVPDVAGYDTTVNLNGAPEPTGVLVPVNDADYYELHVERTNQATHAKETLL